MAAQLALVLGRDHDLPDRHAIRVLTQRVHHAPVADARTRPDARVADRRRADQLVER
jgi:hypothetical protein